MLCWRSKAAALVLACVCAPTLAAAQGSDDGMAEAELVLAVSVTGSESGEGAQQVGSTVAGRLARGQSRTQTLSLTAQRCYAMVAHGGGQIRNLDISLARGSSVVARDSGTTPAAIVRHCAGARAESVRMRVTAFRGSGPFAVGVFRLPEGVTEIVEVESGTSALSRLSALAEAHGANMGAVTALARENLSEGERIERSVTIAPGRCYRILAAGEDGFVDLDLVLLGPGRGRLQEDGTTAPVATLGVLRPLCPAVPGSYRVAFFASEGGGAFAWQILAARPDRPGSPTARRTRRYRIGGAGSGFLPERLRARHREAGEGLPAVGEVLAGQLRSGQHQDFPIEVRGGECFVAIAAGVPSVRRLNLQLLDAFGNERAANRTTNAFPSARICPSVGGRWTVRASMASGYGRFSIQFFGGAP